jgi:hypothetical protein
MRPEWKCQSSACARGGGLLKVEAASSEKRFPDMEVHVQLHEPARARLRLYPGSIPASCRDERAGGVCSPDAETVRSTFGESFCASE